MDWCLESVDEVGGIQSVREGTVEASSGLEGRVRCSQIGWVVQSPTSRRGQPWTENILRHRYRYGNDGGIRMRDMQLGEKVQEQEGKVARAQTPV